MRTLVTLFLVSSLVGCGFVRDFARDPLETTWDLAAPVLEPALPYVLDGALNILVLGLVIIEGDNTYYEDHPAWVCVTTCRDGEPDVDSRVARLDCAHCTSDGSLHFATGETSIVLPEDGWYVEELGDQGPFAASFEASGESAWTWTDGEQRFEQSIAVADGVDVALFDLGAGREVDAIDLSLGETREIEILPVDAEGNVLAATFERIGFDDDLVSAERVGFVTIQGSESGTIARLTADVAGTTTMTVRVAGLERTISLAVR